MAIAAKELIGHESKPSISPLDARIIQIHEFFLSILQRVSQNDTLSTMVTGVVKKFSADASDSDLHVRMIDLNNDKPLTVVSIYRRDHLDFREMHIVRVDSNRVVYREDYSKTIFATEPSCQAVRVVFIKPDVNEHDPNRCYVQKYTTSASIYSFDKTGPLVLLDGYSINYIKRADLQNGQKKVEPPITFGPLPPGFIKSGTITFPEYKAELQRLKIKPQSIDPSEIDFQQIKAGSYPVAQHPYYVLQNPQFDYRFNPDLNIGISQYIDISYIGKDIIAALERIA